MWTPPTIVQTPEEVLGTQSGSYEVEILAKMMIEKGISFESVGLGQGSEGSEFYIMCADGMWCFTNSGIVTGEMIMELANNKI